MGGLRCDCIWRCDKITRCNERGVGAGGREKNDCEMMEQAKLLYRKKETMPSILGVSVQKEVAPSWVKQINLLLIKPQRLLLHSTPTPLCFLRLHLHDLPHLSRSRSLNCQAQTSERFLFFFKRCSVGSSTRNFYLESCRFKGKASQVSTERYLRREKKKSSRPFYISPALIFLLLLF